MKQLPAAISCFIFSLSSLSAATAVIDSFDREMVQMGLGRQLQNEQIDIGDFKTSRYLSLKRAATGAVEGTIVTTTIDPARLGLSFFVDGQSKFPNDALDLHVGYGIDSPLLLAGYKAFEFEILTLSGSGNLIIKTGTFSPNDASATVIPIQNTGILRVPFSDVNFDPNPPNLVGFALRSTAEQFSIKLGEFRVVPEPSSTLFLATALMALTSLRRRSLPFARAIKLRS